MADYNPHHLAFTPGTRLGPYEVTALIGEGGMGEVYRARDVKLKRDVALKVLPDLFARDHDRMSRFQREAELLASLNHPNIATIHGVEDNALVMELVEGETLKGPMAIADALRAARQIAEALEYAHDRGVIHRDLKPANVKITPDGMVKLLDFGLAKAIEDPSAADEKANSPTLSVNATRAGVILGTAAYMSPEQAHGRPADRRADIWSFGTVLYELLTGQPTFTGESVSDTLASVLKIDPDWTALPRETPAAIGTLLRRCLTRDRKLRLQAIGEARIVIDDVLGGRAEEAVAPPGERRRVNWHAVAGWTVAAVCGSLLGFATWSTSRPPEITPQPVARLMADATVAPVPGAIALSRDGAMAAFVGGPKQQIHVRAIDQFEVKPLSGTEGATWVSFSPDGQWISFADGGKTNARLRIVSIDGGPVQTLLSFRSVAGSPSPVWGLDGNILFGNDGALARMSPTGGTPETLAASGAQQDELSYLCPQLLPGGEHVLVSIATEAGPGGNRHRIVALNLRTRQRTTLLERVGVAQYVPARPPATSGHIVFYDRDTEMLMAVAFDPRQAVISGTPAPVLEGVQSSLIGQVGLFGISESGMLAYVGSPGARGGTLVWVDRDGTEAPAKAPVQNYGSSLRLSPDGQRAAVSINPDAPDIGVIDLNRGSLQRLTTDERPGGNPVWTPDGTRLFYERRPPVAAVMTVAADGSGSPSVVTTWKEGTIAPYSVSPDGKLLMGSSGGASRVAWSIPVAVAVKGPSSPDAFPEPRRAWMAPMISPDGRWMAYRSEESGRSEVYVSAYPGPGAIYPISTEGGTVTRWSPTGRELFYRNGDKMMAVPIETSPAFRAGAPKELFERSVPPLAWDVDPSGKRFLMLKRTEGGPSGRISIVLNWVDELRRRVPLPAS